MDIGSFLMQIGTALMVFGLIALFAVFSALLVIGIIFIAERLNDE